MFYLIKKYKILTLLGCLVLSNIYAQKAECEVIMQGLNTTYKGGCKKGKAFGEGIATGELGKYEGSFKKGLPNGTGKLMYAEGTFYEGQWKFGKRHGEGKMVFNNDSTQIGFWESGEYIGRYPYAYKVTETYGPIRVSIKKMNDVGDKIDIVFVRNGLRNLQDVVTMNAQGDSGNYQEGQYMGYQNVVYPFEGSLTGNVKNLMHTTNILMRVRYNIYHQGHWQLVINY